MNPPRQLRIRTAVTYMPAICAACVAIIAILVLVGWAFNIEVFKSLLHPGRIAMNPMTAVSLLLLTVSLWIIRNEPAPQWAKTVTKVFAAIVIVVALTRLSDIWLGSHFGLDHLLFRQQLGINAISPNTAVAFLLISAGLICFDYKTGEKFHPAQVLIITTGSIGLLSLTGYIYRTTELYGIHGYIPMALNSTICFVLLSIGLLCARPRREPMVSLLSDTLGGVVARRLVPAAFLIPLLAGRLQIMGAKLGLYSPDFGLAVLVLINILAFNILIWWCANAMRSSDLRRRITEEVLRGSEERHRAITEQAAEGIYLVDLETKRIVDSNAAMERLLGYTHGEAESKTVYDFVADDPANVDARLAAISTTHGPMHGQRQYRRKDGSLIDIESSATIISYGGRQVACTVAHDITDRKQAEAALRSSELRLRLIIETANDAFVAMDADGIIVDFNPQAERTFGWKRDEAMGRALAQTIIPPAYRDAHWAGLRKFIDTGEGPILGKRLELTALHRDGKEFPVELTISPARVPSGTIFFAFIHDISARKRAEEERDRFFTLSSDLVSVAGFDGHFKRVNAAFTTTLGYTAEEMMSRPWTEFVHPDDLDKTIDEGLKIVSGSRGVSFENRYRCKDGSYKWLSWTSVPVMNEGLIYAIARDMTESKQAQDELQEAMRSEKAAHESLKSAQSQLVQSEKLAGLGQMVAGVAHEINNPLSFVSNNVAVLQRDIKALTQLLGMYSQADALLAEKDAALLGQIKDLSERMDLAYTQKNMSELLDRSREGLRRIQQIVKDLRDFARLDESDLHEIDLNSGIKSTVNIILGKAKKKRVQVDMQLDPLPMVCCYPAKVNQVVMNLVSNAIDAAPEGGKVTINTASKEEQIHIVVSDNGPGVPQHIRGRIFDPFFTTKPIGEGTGLGLSISYGIVRDHGGTIEVGDAPGGGAMFDVTLPKKCPPKTSAKAERPTTSAS